MFNSLLLLQTDFPFPLLSGRAGGGREPRCPPGVAAPPAPPLGRPGTGGCSRGAGPRAAVGQRRALRSGCSRARFELLSSVSDIGSPCWCGGAKNSAFGARASKAADSPRGKVYKRGCSSPPSSPRSSARLRSAAPPPPRRLSSPRTAPGPAAVRGGPAGCTGPRLRRPFVPWSWCHLLGPRGAKCLIGSGLEPAYIILIKSMAIYFPLRSIPHRN